MSKHNKKESVYTETENEQEQKENEIENLNQEQTQETEIKELKQQEYKATFKNPAIPQLTNVFNLIPIENLERIEFVKHVKSSRVKGLNIYLKGEIPESISNATNCVKDGKYTVLIVKYGIREIRFFN